jgi:hypothetical protein
VSHAAIAPCVHSSSSSAKKEQRSDLAKHDSDDNRAPAAVSYVNNETSAPKQQCPCTETPPWWKRPEWWLCILGVPTLGFIGWQARAAKVSADAVMRSERAWLIPKIDHPAFSDVMSPQTKQDGWHLPILVTISNRGKTPALVINRHITSSSELTVDRMATPLELKLPDRLPYAPIGKKGSKSAAIFYAPEEPFFMYLAIPKETLAKERVDWINGERCLCVFGFVEYFDVFRKYHIARFCYAYQSLLPGGNLVNAITGEPAAPPEFQKAGPRIYNEST